MADTTRYSGVNFNNLRKALYYLFFGTEGADNFNSPKYKYIIPMQGNFDNPLQLDEKDTYIMYWIENDKSLTQDDYFVDENNQGFDRQKCVASILVRFIGVHSEEWSRVFRHLCKRSNVTAIWAGTCNAEKLVHTAPIVPTKVNYFGKNSQIAFDARFNLYYDECISTGWKPLTGIDFTIEGNIHVEGEISN